MNSTATSPLRILLAEDDESLQHFFSRALRRAGHSVEARLRGDDAVRALHASEFDVLVLDWRMPGLNGGEVLRAMRMAKVPTRVLVLTGNGEAGRAEAMAAGADDFLEKPCGLHELTAAVAALAQSPTAVAA